MKQRVHDRAAVVGREAADDRAERHADEGGEDAEHERHAHRVHQLAQHVAPEAADAERMLPARRRRERPSAG
jgi:hypothetical protein